MIFVLPVAFLVLNIILKRTRLRGPSGEPYIVIEKAVVDMERKQLHFKILDSNNYCFKSFSIQIILNSWETAQSQRKSRLLKPQSNCKTC
jgi:hypothetical protein